MGRIFFENLPSTKTPINAENLNQMQENMAQATGMILWTNPEPTSEFGIQTITLNTSEFDFYEIIYFGSDTKANCLSTGKIPKGEKAYLNQTYYSGVAKIRQRDIMEITDDSITFGNCLNNGETLNTNLIPVYVIGYKLGLFE